MPETGECYYRYNQSRDNIEAYDRLDNENSNLLGNRIGDLIETPRIAHSTDILVQWIQRSTLIFVVGPSASGKRYLCVQYQTTLFRKL